MENEKKSFEILPDNENIILVDSEENQINLSAFDMIDIVISKNPSISNKPNQIIQKIKEKFNVDICKTDVLRYYSESEEDYVNNLNYL
jgi:hypothetical protein